MTYLLKLQRTCNRTTTTHTVFADEYQVGNYIAVTFQGKKYELKDTYLMWSTELPFSQERSMFNNKFILERLEKE